VKLYNLDHSPYATRVRIQIYKKGLDVAIEAPPVALRTDAFNERFPLGKLPILELDNKHHLPDSWVIMEYLEDTRPAIPLRPQDPMAKAQMQMLARCTDTYLGPGGLFPLFARVASGGATDGADELLANLHTELARLDRLLNWLPEFARRDLHLGDIALVPSVDYILMLMPLFGQQDPLAKYAAITRWWDWVNRDEYVTQGANEMRQAARAFFGG
jgi:glutathione S-transferase